MGGGERGGCTQTPSGCALHWSMPKTGAWRWVAGTEPLLLPFSFLLRRDRGYDASVSNGYGYAEESYSYSGARAPKVSLRCSGDGGSSSEAQLAQGVLHVLGAGAAVCSTLCTTCLNHLSMVQA